MNRLSQLVFMGLSVLGFAPMASAGPDLKVGSRFPEWPMVLADGSEKLASVADYKGKRMLHLFASW